MGGMSCAVNTALGMGPTGDIIGLTSSLSHDEARGIFGRMAEAGAEEGADLILIETMSDIEEVKDAVAASKERTDLPVLCSMSFNETGYTFMGVTPEDFVREARAAGADAVGANCGIGPGEMLPVAEALLRAAEGGIPVFVQPNAGQPKIKGAEVYYDMTPETFAEGVRAMIEAGVKLAGGCCGTTPDMIALLRDEPPIIGKNIHGE
jgi:5-methyltetrahydrofolate--homocysteine methyltransferase